MLFWVLGLGIATLGAVPIVLAILRAESGADTASDLSVYRDQMEEIDRDLARGVLTEDEAERTRAEVGRRLLEADKRGPRAVSPAPRAARIAAGVAVVLLVGAGGVALYATQGAPGYPDLPLRARIADAAEQRQNRPSQAEAEARAAASLPEPVAPAPEFAALMDRLRTVVQDRPDDAQGYALLAQNELRLGRLKAARAAQERLLELRGDDVTAEDLALMGEILVSQAGGLVTPEAESLIDGALNRDRSNGRALYLKGLAAAQVGRFDVTFRIWQDALAIGTGDGVWRESIRAQMPDVARRAGQDYTPPAPRGPDAADMQAAQDMDPEAREEMIRGMVEGLSQRLATDGGAAPEWAQLIGALGVLGETDRAEAILAEARQVFANQPDDLQLIEDAARRGGL